jgi:peptide/nickel transport system ATP-binding protein
MSSSTVVVGPRSRRGPVNRDEVLLEIKNLSVTFTRRGARPVKAVDGVSYAVKPGEIVGIVGESGSGKSVTSLAIMGLLPKRGVQVTGEALYRGENLLAMNDRTLSDLRGSELAMVFQDPMSSLNPVVPIGVQVTEVLLRHQGRGRGPAAPLRHPRSAPTPQGVSAPDVRRDAAAGADRHLARLQACAADL